MKDTKEWYKKFPGIILAVLIFPLFLIWYAWSESKWSKNKKLLVTAVCVVLVGLVLITPPPKPVEKKDEIKTETKQEEKPRADEQPQVTYAYEVLENNKNGGVKKITVYTTETDNSRIIALNDKLVDENKNGVSMLYIEYFNDKLVAKDYFDKQLDESVSEETKNELYTHYVAKMIFNNETGYKSLIKQYPEQTTLKDY